MFETADGLRYTWQSHPDMIQNRLSLDELFYRPLDDIPRSYELQTAVLKNFRFNILNDGQ